MPDALDNYRLLGRSGLRVSPLCLGTMTFGGASEELLGRLIAGRRQQLVISTKYSLTMRPGDPNASGNQRKNMLQSVEDSLRRLDTDCIDLLYLHVWDRRTPAAGG